jgi:hypothetical protein
MYAHVITYRLGSEAETTSEREWANREGEVINDQTARTLANWWHSPADNSRNITSLSHGLPFDTDGLRDEIAREVTDLDDQQALLAYVDQLEAILSDVTA